MGTQHNQIQKVTTLGTVGAIDAKESGDWDYIAGTGGGTFLITGRVVGMFGYANGSAGTITIDAGDPITVRSGNGFTLNPKGNLENTTIIFSASLDYMIEFVTG